ncbi:HAD-IIIC family phosphatase [Leptolyngbya sp. PCC 6406]|uniref:HAD-IIIC family phosphatase n=1 Tax=Leptolyngbya sp. PCC 6406 TaxID=1173264 RepID=UPI0002ABA88D|nr:HAD-IIIC family phosphatase [Leptolyngbya sp. PCC 6406]
MVHQQSLKSDQLTKTTKPSQSTPALAIASTFTIEPIRNSLNFWIEELSLSLKISFSGYNQIFQELIDPNSLFSKNAHGCNVILIRLEDWLRDHSNSDIDIIEEDLKRNIDDLSAALVSSSSRCQAPHIVIFCPHTPFGEARNSESINLLNNISFLAIERIKSIDGIYVITATNIHHWYPCVNYYNRRTDELGHIPFTPEYFSALGTTIIRKYQSLTCSPYKVIVLDCDQTLWKGVCGEDGPQGIVIDPARQFLQEFMVKQTEQGMLISLCSKNVEEDVIRVYDVRSDMPLQREHIVAWRINWQPKSENIRSLAQELNLGLDSFIFIDDNPVECSEVMANCPEVLTLQLPQKIDEIPNFLEHVWAFDHSKVATGADLQRTLMYKQNLERERVRSQALDFEEFLNGLDLQVSILPMKPNQLVRVAQLTQRTNQFNATTIRRSESTIQQLCAQGGYQFLTVDVKDRFGDYGLVGTVIYGIQNSSLEVDTFLLSCRVLGRSVEYRMLAELGRIALEQNLDRVNIPYIYSAKNQPLIDFLNKIGGEFSLSTSQGIIFSFPADYARSIKLTSDDDQPIIKTSKESQSESSVTLKAEDSESNPMDKISPSSHIDKISAIDRVANCLSQLEAIHAAVEKYRKGLCLQSRQQKDPPRNQVESALVEIWGKVLGLEQVGIHEDYFDIGGDSLLAVSLFVEIEDAFQKKLPMTVLLESPTIEKLGRKILETETIQTSWPSLIKLRSNGTGPSLFMVHGGFGDVLGLVTLEKHLDTNYSFYALQGIGLDGIQNLPPSIEAIASCFIDEIKLVQPQGPYFLGGQCSGGTIAYEMAQQLQQGGDHVEFLALLDTPYPPLTNYFAERLRFYQSNRPLLYQPSQALYYVFTCFNLRWKVAYHIRQFQRRSLKEKREYLYSYGQRFVKVLIKKMHLPLLNKKRDPHPFPVQNNLAMGDSEATVPSLGSTVQTNSDSEINTISGSSLFPRHSSDRKHALIKHRFFEDLNQALSIYKPKPYDGKIAYFLPLLNSYAATCSPKNWRAFFPHDKPVSAFPSLSLGWDKVAKKGLEIHEFEGTHIGMIREPQVKLLAEKINSCLNLDATELFD